MKQILCNNKQCSSRNREDGGLKITNDLLLVGTSYKCPYCRGDIFIIVEEEENGT